MALTEELERIAASADAFAQEGEELAGILVAEPSAGRRTYLCAYERSDGSRAWLAFDADAHPVEERAAVREAVSIAAMCEIAEESAGGGDLAELRAQLVNLRQSEAPEGIDEAEEAALELERTLDPAPRVASPAYLDAVGAATRRLERALGGDSGSPFAAAMRQAAPTVDDLAAEIERNYKRPLA